MTEWSECRDCRRELKDPVYRRLGYGRECGRKRGLIPPRKPRRPRKTNRQPKPASVPPAPDALPGQTEIDLHYFEPTLDSL